MITFNNQIYYTVSDIVNLTGYGEALIRLKIRNGDLVGEKVGRAYLVTEADLRDFINSDKQRRKKIAEKRSTRQSGRKTTRV